MNDLRRIEPKRLTGAEPFVDGGAATAFTISDFWRWSVSDLVSNATRGRLAEYIVARALGIATDGVRDEWAPYDLITADGVRIEVKSAAYLQSWHQTALSKISFSIRKARIWDPETNLLDDTPVRAADVYVFALLAHQEKVTLDPLKLDQWEFYVVPTRVLDERARSQHSITLVSLKGLAAPVRFSELVTKLRSAVAIPPHTAGAE